MKNEKKGDSLRREAIPSTSIGPEQQMAESLGFFKERPLPTIELAPRVLRNQTRRDVLLFGVGALAALAGAGFLLPQDTLSRIGIRRNMNSRGKKWFLNKVLRIDDDVAELRSLISGRVVFQVLIGDRHNFANQHRPVMP